MKEDADKEYSPKMSIDSTKLQIKVNDKILQMNIWDCCGNDKFAWSTPNLFKNISIAIIVYAINDKNSYNDVEKWYNMLKEHSEGSIIFIIGNKSDLDEEREITMEEGEKFKDNYDDIN